MRKLAWFAGAFSAGVFLAQYLLGGAWLFAGAAACLPVACGCLLLPKAWCRRGVVLFLALGLGLGYHGLYCRLVQRPMEALVGTERVVAMTLCGDPVATQYGAKATVRVEGLPGKAVYYGDAFLADLRPGQTVTDTVSFQSASDIRDDNVTTFTSKGVFLLAYGQGDAPQIADGTMDSVRWWPARAGRAIRQRIETIFDGDAAGFLSAILTGEKTGLSAQAANDLSEAGIYHILAVSGMHCGFLLTAVQMLVGRHRRRLCAACAVPILIFYAMLTGGSPSVVRACVMLTMLLAAPLFDRESDGPTALTAALFLILLENPFAAASVSLQLSFAAMAGILWLTPRLYARLAKGGGRLRAILGASFSATMGALVFSTPVSAVYFGALPLISPVSNLLCLWAAGLVFTLGLAAVLLSFLWLPLGTLAAFPARLLAGYILQVSHVLADLPYHAVYFANPYLKYWLIFAYVLFAAAWLSKGKGKYALASVCAALTLAVTVWLGSAQYDGDLEIVMLDAGQGQSIVFASEGAFALADCGSANSWYDPGGDAADLLLTMGCRKLDHLILTHYDSDHVNGVENLLSRLDVENLWIPAQADEDGLQEEILAAAGNAGVAVSFVETAQDVPLGSATLTLFPSAGTARNDNEQGLSLLAALGEKAFFLTGDMDAAAEKRLLAAYDLPDVEVLAAGHHGSKNATSKLLLDTLRPETVCISVGSNSYGHPAEETLERLEKQGCAVYRTDLRGDIRISWNGGSHHGKESDEK